MSLLRRSCRLKQLGKATLYSTKSDVRQESASSSSESCRYGRSRDVPSAMSLAGKGSDTSTDRKRSRTESESLAKKTWTAQSFEVVKVTKAALRNLQTKGAWMDDNSLRAVALAIINRYRKKSPGIFLVDSTLSEVLELSSDDAMMGLVRRLRLDDSAKLLIFPYFDANHWSLIVFDRTKKIVNVVDSLPGLQSPSLRKKIMLRFASFIDRVYDAKTTRKWKEKVLDFYIQLDHNSCGIFVCCAIEKFCAGEDLFSPEDYKRGYASVVVKTLRQKFTALLKTSSAVAIIPDQKKRRRAKEEIDDSDDVQIIE